MLVITVLQFLARHPLPGPGPLCLTCSSAFPIDCLLAFTTRFSQTPFVVPFSFLFLLPCLPATASPIDLPSSSLMFLLAIFLPLLTFPHFAHSPPPLPASSPFSYAASSCSSVLHCRRFWQDSNSFDFSGIDPNRTGSSQTHRRQAASIYHILGNPKISTGVG